MSSKNKYYYARKSKKCYYSDLWQAYIYDYYVNKSFPLFGWIKPCFYCGHVGSSFQNWKYLDKNIIIHTCKRCIRKYKDSDAMKNSIYKRLENAEYIIPNSE